MCGWSLVLILSYDPDSVPRVLGLTLITVCLKKEENITREMW